MLKYNRRLVEEQKRVLQDNQERTKKAIYEIVFLIIFAVPILIIRWITK